MFTRMKLSWRLLFLRTYLQKPTSFSYRKVQSSSISPPFHTQSRTQHTQTTKPINTIYPYGSFESKTGLTFSPTDGVTKKKNHELELDLKSVAENRTAIEEKMDEVKKDLKWSITENSNAIEEKRDKPEWDLKAIADNRNAVEGKSDEVEKDLMAILEEKKGVDLEDALTEIAESDAMNGKWSEEFWDSCYREAVDILIEFSEEDDIKRELNHLKFDQDLIKNVLEDFESNPNTSKRFFHFLLHKDGDELDYECYSALYNSMLCVFGVNRLFGEFWELAEFMNTKRCLVSVSSCKEKRYLIHMDTWEKVSEFYCKHGLASELQKLNMFVVIQYMDNRMINIGHLLNSVPEMWKDRISDQVCVDFVKIVLEHVRGGEALRFLRWIAGSDDLCKVDEQTYNFIASVLGKEDDKYKKLVGELIMSGDDTDKREWQVTREITKLYEYAVSCSDTVPSVNWCIYLIMKIRLYDDKHMQVFSNYITPDAWSVIQAFEKNGGILTDSDVGEVINMVVSGNKINDLNQLADHVMYSRDLKVRDHPFSFNETYTEIDRKRRARVMFSDLQKEISEGTNCND